MLEDVAAALGVQVIVVTHALDFARGDVYQVRMVDRTTMRSVVEKVEAGDA